MRIVVVSAAASLRFACGRRAISGWLGLGVWLLAAWVCPAQREPASAPVSVELGVAVSDGSGPATFRFPDGPRGQYKHGFRVLNDSAAEW